MANENSPTPEASPGIADRELLERVSGALKIGSYSRHIFLCTHGDCAPAEECTEAWKFLKRRLRQLKLSEAAGGVFRTQAACLRVCREGPVFSLAELRKLRGAI